MSRYFIFLIFLASLPTLKGTKIIYTRGIATIPFRNSLARNAEENRTVGMKGNFRYVILDWPKLNGFKLNQYSFCRDKLVEPNSGAESAYMSGYFKPFKIKKSSSLLKTREPTLGHRDKRRKPK